MRYSDLILNPNGRTQAPYGPSELEIFSTVAFRAAFETIQKWPGYKATPLHGLKGLAEQVGLGAIYYKDESERFSLKSFKALGGAYAVAQLTAGMHDPAALTVTCATDGNHGRSVAWGADQRGCPCVIFVHKGVSKTRIEAIQAYGAKVVRVSGNYDESVRHAAEAAAVNGWTVVSDTSYQGYSEIPRLVMQGYTVLVHEALETLCGQPPTHVFVQGGVGGLAAAVAAHFWEHFGAQRPMFVVVEPDRADCLLQSAKASKAITVHGKLDTIMAGLACGEPSQLAWHILKNAGDAFMSIPDESACEAMRLVAYPDDGDIPIVGGESGVAGLAGLLACASDPHARSMLRLDDTSRVMVIGTEGDTDPVFYRHVVGKDAEEILVSRRVDFQVRAI